MTTIPLDHFLLEARGYSFMWRVKELSTSLIGSGPLGLLIGLAIVFLLLALLVGGFFLVICLFQKGKPSSQSRPE
jgi:hypothetical protein